MQAIVTIFYVLSFIGACMLAYDMSKPVDSELGLFITLLLSIVFTLLPIGFLYFVFKILMIVVKALKGGIE